MRCSTAARGDDSPSPMIRFSEVSKSYAGGHDALKRISFRIDKGEFVFITGHSGAGKSTLLRLIALIERQSGGEIAVNGQDLGRIRRAHVPYYRRRIGFIFQDHRLLSDRSVFENVALPLTIAGLTPNETGRRVRAALDRVGLLSKEKDLPTQLSAGEQQRVGIARAVAHKPDILIADEPTGNLDAELSYDIMELFDLFNQVGVTVVIATHDLDLLRSFGHRSITLRAGQVESEQELAK
ncbi:MAG: Cell division ATP-binding protein FtsE [Gammaproteobacteria bacterium]|nr:Cell division ATP-binding protein FtsE [Gammaproteobacteria bacterium]